MNFVENGKRAALPKNTEKMVLGGKIGKKNARDYEKISDDLKDMMRPTKRLS